MGKQGKVNIPMMLACVLLCLTLFSMHLTGGLFARYTATDTASDSARVAKFRVTGELSDGVTVDCAAGSSGSCVLTVTNHSEVAVSYGLDIRFEEALGDLWTVSLMDGATKKPGTIDGETIHYGTLGSLAPGGQKSYSLEFTVSDWTYVTTAAVDPASVSVSKELNFIVDIHAVQVD